MWSAQKTRAEALKTSPLTDILLLCTDFVETRLPVRIGRLYLRINIKEAGDFSKWSQSDKPVVFIFHRSITKTSSA